MKACACHQFVIYVSENILQCKEILQIKPDDESSQVSLVLRTQAMASKSTSLQKDETYSTHAY